MSWVVLEGPDGTGKTTLAEKLRQSGYLYQHCGPEDNLAVLAKRMAHLQGLKHVVWDRCHLGEAVYGSLDRGATPPAGWWRIIEAFLIEKRAICVLLTEQHEDKPDYLEKSGKVRYQEVLAAYERTLAASALTWKDDTYFTYAPVDNTDASEPWEWRTDPEGLGGMLQDIWDISEMSIAPEKLVLGEQQNPLANVPWPFATRCGLELVWPMVNPRRIRVSNALRANRTLEPKDLHDRWEALSFPEVVTLGKVAENACRQADIDVTVALPHPQYHLRFHAHEAQAYRHQLEVALA